MPDPAPLPVHGFVLAGGRSTRMGTDKATLPFHGRPMVQIAVEKLRTFCAEVSIAGNRPDLAPYAEVIPEIRLDAGPAAGIEAGLRAARHPWALFIPVDVPLVPHVLLRRWAQDGLSRSYGKYFEGSYLQVHWKDQPAFCLLKRDVLQNFSRELNLGQRRLSEIFFSIEPKGNLRWILPTRVEDLTALERPSYSDLEQWFLNVNTPEELASAEGA